MSKSLLPFFYKRDYSSNNHEKGIRRKHSEYNPYAKHHTLDLPTGALSRPCSHGRFNHCPSFLGRGHRRKQHRLNCWVLVVQAGVCFTQSVIFHF
ncbi:hypothetical protein BJX68DRAFT_229367 [Aspergillus pseudodeflectus]|uniref:Uncharacterized protein n=1 Tax=Aspergillus pseudodeflectus TaxID=176178 RepID=A0ABR4KZT3_9EURO